MKFDRCRVFDDDFFHRYLGSVGQCRPKKIKVHILPFERNVMFFRIFSGVTEYDYILSAVFLLY